MNFYGDIDSNNYTVNLNGGNKFTKTVDDNTYDILFLGRLYNRDEIIIGNEDISSVSDAELILLTYIKYGYDAFEIIDGSFSLAIYDYSRNIVILARDRLGTLPLYYTNNTNESNFIFSTRIYNIFEKYNVKAIVGKDELCEIFGLGPAHSPGKTFFKDIYEVLPGHYMTIQNSKIENKKYWDLTTFNIEDSLEQSILKSKLLVKESLERQLNTTKPVSAMLSGGLDSSVLTYLAKEHNNDLNTYSIDFDGNSDNFEGNAYQPTRDSDFVKIMVDKYNLNHTELTFTTKELYDNLKTAMLAREMPGMADVDSSMLVFLKKLKECGCDTILSGECSDEIFGGYPWYYKEHLINSSGFPWSRSLETRKNILNENLVSSSYLEQYVMKALEKTSENVIYNSGDIAENTFRRTCYNTVKWFMNTLVERTSRMASAVGIEVRIPFADYRLFDYAYNVSYKYKLGLIDGNETPIEKYLLRKAFENELPTDIVYRKKSPFPKTYDPKYLEMLEDEIKNIINKSSSPILEVINIKYLYEILNTHGENLKENWFGQLMTYPQTIAYLIQVNMWLEAYSVEIDV